MTNVEHFIDIGIALSTEKDHNLLLEKILKTAKQLANADGGSIYSIQDGQELKFETIINDSLNLHLGGSTENPITFPNIPLYINGEENRTAMATYAALSGEVLNIEDAYLTKDFNTQAAKDMDARNDYRTQSLLTVPMTDHNGDLNGVLQLINALDEHGNTITFDQQTEQLVKALSSLAAVVITNKTLIVEMESLFSTFSQLIAKAIDTKSPYTGGHCRRVPEITMMLAQACHDIDYGPIANFSMTTEEFHELGVAAWLHDCGKIATPESVMDKATKLQTIADRIDLVNAKFAIVSANIHGDQTLSSSEKEQQLTELEDHRVFLNHANKGGEYFDDESVARVHHIAEYYRVEIAGKKQPLLSDNERDNLCIAKGTLTAEERRIINGHMDVTVEMLESMNFPKHLKRVPEYACGHHEKMDGTGYPKGLTREEMSEPARMMAIADIFEALTANDRPYKDPKNLSESLRIMGFMKLDNHIDPDLFDVFVDQKIYLKFAEKCLDKSQIDEVKLTDIPGYVLPENRN